MKYDKHIFEKLFLWKWILYTFISFPVGLFLSFPLAYLINIIYPKETNLVVGICIGAAAGYSQWLVLRKNVPIKSFWGLASGIGIGIPFILTVVLNETGIKVQDISENNITGWLLTGVIGGLLSALLQWPLLKPFFRKAGWWLAINPAGWGVSFLTIQLTGRSVLAGSGIGAILLGVITGIGILWINKLQD